MRATLYYWPYLNDNVNFGYRRFLMSGELRQIKIHVLN